MVRDESLDVLAAGAAAAGEAARYGVRGDGVVADEDGGVEAIFFAGVDNSNPSPLLLQVEFTSVYAVGDDDESRVGRCGEGAGETRRARLRRVRPRAQRADHVILSASRVRNFPSASPSFTHAYKQKILSSYAQKKLG